MTEETVIVGPLRRIAVVKHGDHIGQEARPGEIGGSQPGFTHEGVSESTDGEGHSVGEIYGVNANFFGTEEDILVELKEWDSEAEAWIIEIISGPSRENTEEIGASDLWEPDEADLAVWTEVGGDALEGRVRSIFGLTDNFTEAGYILADGDMLDFSGKREGGSPGMRAMDHREVSRAFLDEEYPEVNDTRGYGSGTDNMIYFLKETGAVRTSYIVGRIPGQPDANTTIDIYSKPTQAQWSVIGEMAEFSTSFYADLTDPVSGRVIWSAGVNEEDDIPRALSELKFQAVTRFEEEPERSMVLRMTLRHGKHIDQEGREGEAAGGSRPGFVHEEGSIDGEGEWNPEDDNEILFGRKLALDEEFDEENQARGVEFRNSATQALKDFYEKVGIKPRGLTITNSYLDLADAVIEDQSFPGLNRFELAEYLAGRSFERNVVGSYENDTLWLIDNLEGDFALGGDKWNSFVYHELGHWVHNDVLFDIRDANDVPQITMELNREIVGSNRFIEAARKHYGDDTAVLRREYVADLVSAIVRQTGDSPPSFTRWDLGVLNETERGDLVMLRGLIDRAIEESPGISRAFGKLSKDRRVIVLLPEGAGEMLFMTAEEAGAVDWSEGVEIVDPSKIFPIDIRKAIDGFMLSLRKLFP